MLRPDRIVRKAVRSSYLITTTTEESFEGVLVDADEKTLVLSSVVQVAPDGSRVNIQGDLIIPRSTVKYLLTVTV